MENNIYHRAKISVAFLDVFIFVGLLAILIATVYLSQTGGFDIRFDTGGGSEIATQRLRYGESVIEPEVPIKEGYDFLGWYADKALTKKVEISDMTATESITLYASWKEK